MLFSVLLLFQHILSSIIVERTKNSQDLDSVGHANQVIKVLVECLQDATSVRIIVESVRRKNECVKNVSMGFI